MMVSFVVWGRGLAYEEVNCEEGDELLDFRQSIRVLLNL